tara:strand:+ start:1571 stop:2413 length:843 start_codon:yes stop_codon:yes gene_type:complete
MEEQTTAPEVQSEPTATVNNEQPQAQPSFIDSLPEDIRSESSLQNFTDAGQLAKSYIHAQRMVGADKMPVPTKNFTNDDWKETFTKLGVPSSPDKYDVQYNLQEGANDQPVKDFISHAHTLGLLPQQLQGVLDYYGNLEQTSLDNAQKDQELNRVNNETALRKEFGLAYDKKLNQANDVFKNFFAEELAEVKLQDGTSIGNHPGFIKALATMSEKFSEDTISAGQESAGGLLTPQEAQKEVSKIMGDINHPYWIKEHPNHDAAVKEVADLNNMIHPVSTG